jgi:pimeloyl-ACP methyl ester carboxylesterase
MKLHPASSSPSGLDGEEEKKKEDDWAGWMGSAVPVAAASIAVWSVLLMATSVGTLAACTLLSVGGVTYSAFLRAPRWIVVRAFGRHANKKEGLKNAREEGEDDLLHKDIQEVEDALLLSCGVRVRHMTFNTPDAASVHAIQALPAACAYSRDHAKSEKMGRVGVLLVHGTYSSCVTFSRCLAHFMQSAAGYDVWAVDLPGFGRSVDPKFPGALSCQEQQGTERIVQAQVDAVRRVVDAMGYAQVMVVGHSLGAYVSMEYAMQYPRRVSHLVLACPPGIFPTLGSIGACWGAILRQSIYMQQVVQFAGSVGAAAFDGSLRLVGTSRPLRESMLYWYRLNCTHQAWGVQGLYRLMDFGWTHAVWRRPLLSRMRALGGIRMLTVYGERDTLVPSHQGVVLARLLSIPCTIMQGAAHLIFSDDRGAKEFCSAVIDWHRSPVSAPLEAAFCCDVVRSSVNDVDGVDLASFQSCFLPARTRRTIARLYVGLGVDEATVHRILYAPSASQPPQRHDVP